MAIIVPVKGRDPKNRLEGVLTPRQRRQLVFSMLEDMLLTFAKTELVRDTYLVTADLEIGKFGRGYGANVVRESTDTGVNDAVRLGMLQTPTYDTWLVVPADIPFMTVQDLRRVLAIRTMGATPIISPSLDDDGTNLLLLDRGRNLVLQYDNDSYHNHVREAVAKSYPFAVYYSESIALDIDSYTDLQRALKFGKRSSTLTYIARVLHRKAAISSRLSVHEERHTNRKL
jgi:2-phospho-L-lactate guanylyltransferase